MEMFTWCMIAYNSRAGVTRSKGDFVKKYSTRVNAEQETWKGRTGIKNTGGRRPLCQKKKVPTKDVIGGCRSGQRSHLGWRRTHKKTIYEIVSVNIGKRIVRSSVGLRQDKDWTLLRGRPPPKRKKWNSAWWRNG
ncbi:hypothetical protein B7P43_G11148 [Cryptotermes secundus]|uniref:Uncharacterized protein n=1 Tax=Cryptotermes secundus TaxID=105785 RepID=A0A2J7QBD5_9NEOP|nr:hypothetical protein B7P43_G11148 [Cryptotermes secundus]